MPKKSKEAEALSILPLSGKSRWRQFAPFCPVSREKFRQLYIAGKAPQPERLGVRCTFFDNAELHRWLKDPSSYKVNKSGEV